MQQFDITVPTVGSFVVHAPGRYIKYMSGSNGGGDASLILTPGAQGGNKIRLQPGFAYRVADDQPMPDSWTLQNAAGGAPIIGQVVIGNGKIDDSTVQGVVQMVDGGKVRTLAGGSFMLSQLAALPTAGNTAMLQLRNVSTNMRIVLESIAVQSTTGATQIGYGVAGAAFANAGGFGVSKNVGGAMSAVGRGYWQNTGANNAPQQFSVIGVVQSQTTEKKLNEPIIIPPGAGVAVWNGTPTMDLWATFEWYEEPNV